MRIRGDTLTVMKIFSNHHHLFQTIYLVMKSSIKSMKTGLKSREVSKDHFSSNLNKKSTRPYSHLIIRLLQGYSLLASDIGTGKSDPVCFFKITSIDDVNPNMDPSEVSKGNVIISNVCKTTIDPIWNEDITLPVNMDDINNLLQMKLVIYVRDEDINEDGMGTGTGTGLTTTTTYDELGMIEVPFPQLFRESKILKGAMVLSARKYILKKSPGMRRVDGSLKLTISMVFSEEDCDNQLQRPELGLKSLQDMMKKLKYSGKSGLLSISQSLPSNDADDNGDDDNNNNGGQVFTSDDELETSFNMDPLDESNSNVVSSNQPPPEYKTNEYKSLDKESGNINSTDSLEVSRDIIISPEKFQSLVEELSEMKKRLRRLEPGNLNSENGMVVSNRSNNNDSHHDHNHNHDSNIISNIVSPKSSKVQTPKVQSLKFSNKQNSFQVKNENSSESEIIEMTTMEEGPSGGDEALPAFLSGAIHSVKSSVEKIIAPIEKVISHKSSETPSSISTTEEKTKNPTEKLQESKDIKITDIIKSNAMSSVTKTTTTTAEITATVITNKPISQESMINKNESKNEVVTNNNNTKTNSDGTTLIDRILGEKNAVPEKGIEKVSEKSVISPKNNTVPSSSGSTNTTTITTTRNSVPTGGSHELPETLVNSAKDSDTSISSAGGNAASAARALREVAQQRDILQKQLEELTRITSQGLLTLSQRVDEIEKQTLSITMKPLAKESLDTDSIVTSMSKVPSSSNSVRPKTATSSIAASVTTINAKDDRVKTLRQFKQQALATKLLQTTGAIDNNSNSNSNSNSSNSKKVSNFDAELLIKGSNGEIRRNSIRHDEEEPEITLSSDRKQDKNILLSKSMDRSSSDYSKNSHKVNWAKIDKWHGTGDSISCFSEALDRGDLRDVAKVMEITGPKPEGLSVSLRNRTYDCVAIMLTQNMNVERCLIWILAVVRGKDNLLPTIAKHTIRELVDALHMIGREPSRRGLLASLLASQLDKSFYHNSY